MLAFGSLLLLTLAQAETLQLTGSATWQAGTFSDTEENSAGHLSMGVSSDWFDTSWSHRTAITVQENSGTDLADYSVSITLDTASLVSAGTLSSDGSDLRFTDAAGSELGHWVESGMNSASTVVWVRISTLSASSSEQIWAYHGNPGAANASDKSAAMLWWDDFSTNTIANYDFQGLYGFQTESWAIDASSGWAYNTNDRYTAASLLPSGISVSDDYYVETRAYTNDNDGLGCVGNVNTDGSEYYGGQTWDTASNRSGVCKNRSDQTCAASAGVSTHSGEIHTYVLKRHGGQITMGLDGTDRITLSDGSPLSGTRLGLLSDRNSPAGYFDYLLIRRWVSAEPTAVVGTTEVGPPPSATWDSDVIPTGCADSTFDSVRWTQLVPSGTSVSLLARSGTTATPDATWSGWDVTATDAAGSTLGLGPDSYLQLQVNFGCTHCTSPPWISEITLTYSPAEDSDGDGDSTPACGGSDCDDGDSSAYSGAAEVCDTVDNDCDGAVDEDDAADAITWYLDHDADGYGAAALSTTSCTQPASYVADATDCDDTDPTSNPGGTEVCDGADNDCDGTADGDDAADRSTWYGDADGDGFGDTATTALSCTQPSDFVANATDCDDANAAFYPGSTETCDGADNDCDGVVDEDDAADAGTWFLDHDADGYGDAAHTANSCTQPASYVADATDCDDTDAASNPGGTEVCDGADNDCDGTADGDDAVDRATWYADNDSDGFGDAASSTLSCTQPTGFVEDGSDCDDAAAGSHPGAADTWYDGVDSVCDGADDFDQDGDGHQADAFGGDDCDDEDDDIHPGAFEDWYDGVDADCDRASDYDADTDGFDSASYGGEDCDDADADTYPGAPDVPYDGVINDCERVDDFDQDGDGHRAADHGGEDCDDANSHIHPRAEDTWYDGVDSDCDGADDFDADGDGYPLDTDCDDADADIYPGAEGWNEDCTEVQDTGDTGAGEDTGDTGSDTAGGSGVQVQKLEGDGGCGCSATPRGRGGLLLLLLPLIAFRRRAEDMWS